MTTCAVAVLGSTNRSTAARPRSALANPSVPFRSHVRIAFSRSTWNFGRERASEREARGTGPRFVGGPAVMELRAEPVRPVTLRRHLSMALPLSESLGRSRSSRRRSWMVGRRLLAGRSAGRQEVDRIDDRDRRNSFLGTEVEGLHPRDDAACELRRLHVGGFDLAERDRSIRLDRHAKDDLPAKGRVASECAVVESIERGLVPVEDDLDLFVGAGRRRAAPGEGTIPVAAPGADRAGRPFDRDALQAIARAARAATQLRDVDAPARASRLGSDHRSGRQIRGGTPVVRDPRVRSESIDGVGLINSWELFREMFKKMEKKDAEAVVEAVVPILEEMIKDAGNVKGQAISNKQVDAKDGLFIMLDYAGGEGKKAAERVLIDWCVKDYNHRAMAGQYNIKTIVRKIGPAAAEALIPLLSVDELVIKYVAELIRKVGDEAVLDKASAQLGKNLNENVEKIEEVHLVSAAIIGGEHVGNTLLDLSTNNDVSAGLQRFALRALSESVSKKALLLDDKHVGRLFLMAENRDYDQYQREETYYVIAQAGRQEDIPRLKKLLAEKSSFWRAVGLRCILRIDGEGQLGSVLGELARNRRTKTKDDFEEIIERVSAFPKLLGKVRECLEDKSPFVRAVAVGVLAKLGTKDDLSALKKMAKDATKLPRGIGPKNLAEATKAAIEEIEKRG